MPHAYAIATTASYVIALCIAITLARRDHRPWREITDVLSIAVLSALLGSKLFHVLFESQGHVLPNGHAATGVLDLLHHDPFHWARLFEPGYVFDGGVLVSTVITATYVYRTRLLDPLAYGDYAAPGLAFGIFLGRLGCYAAGCCYGKANIPIQLFDSAFGLAAFIFVIMRYEHRRFFGEVFFNLLIAYNIWRFFSEFFRGDIERGLWFNGLLSTSQLISLLVLPFLLVLRGLVSSNSQPD